MSVVVAWLRPVSSPSTPLITNSFGPRRLVERTRGRPTFFGLVEAWTSSEASAMDTSFTPSWRSFWAKACSTTWGSPSPAGCSWNTSIAVERSSVYSRSWESS